MSADEVITERQAISRRLFYQRLAIGLGVGGVVMIGAGIYEGWFARAPQPLEIDTTPLIGHPAPDFTLPNLDGQSLSLAGLRGKPVLLNFWATWCVPCKSELPALQRFADEQKGRWTVLGVDELETRDAVAAFAHSLDIRYPLATDADGVVGQRYRIGGLPSTFAIDAQGIVRVVHLGPLAAGDLQQLMKQVGKGGA